MNDLIRGSEMAERRTDLRDEFREWNARIERMFELIRANEARATAETERFIRKFDADLAEARARRLADPFWSAPMPEDVVVHGPNAQQRARRRRKRRHRRGRRARLDR